MRLSFNTLFAIIVFASALPATAAESTDTTGPSTASERSVVPTTLRTDQAQPRYFGGKGGSFRRQATQTPPSNTIAPVTGNPSLTKPWYIGPKGGDTRRFHPPFQNSAASNNGTDQ